MSLLAPLWLRLSQLTRFDEVLSATALALMTLIPLVEMALRPVLGSGIENAPVLVQHAGLAMTMMGALAAQRHGHLTRLGNPLAALVGAGGQVAMRLFASWSAAFWCGVLALTSWQFVQTEIEGAATLAYGLPVWWVQALMPLGLGLLGLKLGLENRLPVGLRLACSIAGVWAGFWVGLVWGDSALPLWPGVLWLLAALLAGGPIFVALGGLALCLFWQEGQPLASVALSQYQITVNPSLPALPLFTLAGLVFARTQAAQRLGDLFLALFGSGLAGTVVAVTVLCSCFTAFTGGSGVTLLALGGLLLPMLTKAGMPQHRGIGLVTSASALGVLLAPSVPLIMYAILARVPIQTMFLAGVLPAVVMVISLLVFGGYLRQGAGQVMPPTAKPERQPMGPAFWRAKWELMAPLVAIGSLGSGVATPTESAALTAAFAIVSQGVVHRDLSARQLAGCLSECAQIIGGVMLILGMALGLTNFLVDSGLPNEAIDWVQGVIPNKHLFLLVLSVFLLAAGALMEIYAALVFLVPLLLPMAMSYGIDPVHFGIIFLANMEMGFLAPPAGMNLYFASAMFGKPVREIAVAVLPAVLAIFVGSLIIAVWPDLSLALPRWLALAQG